MQYPPPSPYGPPPYGYGQQAPGYGQNYNYGHQGYPYRPPVPPYRSAALFGLLALIGLGLAMGAQWLVHAVDVVYWGGLIDGDTVLAAEGVLLLLHGLLRLVAAIIFLVWIHAAACNTLALGKTMTITPGWAVAWFFIPIASLWMPYKAMAEIAANADSRNFGITPIAVPLWWGGFVVGNLFRILGNSLQSVVDFEVRLIVNLIGTVSLTGALIALAVLITSINRSHATDFAQRGR